MSARSFPWVQVLGTVLLVVFGWWFYTEKLEWEDYTSNQPPSREVRNNPLFASMRLLDAYNYRAEEIKDIRFFNELDDVSNEVIWLLEADSVTDAQVFENLKDWVSRGGHLMLGLDDPMSDRLDVFLASLDIEAYTAVDDIGRTEQWEFEYIKWLNDLEDEEAALTPSPHGDAPYERRTKLSDNRGNTLLTLKSKNSANEAMTILYNNDAEIFAPEPILHGVHWPGSKNESTPYYVNVQIQHEKGVVTVLGDPAMFHNRGLDKFDNSSYLLKLLSRHPSKDIHYFVTQRITPTLLNTLWRKFPQLLILLGVALLAWVMYAAARLGTIRTETTPGKTNLVSHLRARGHFWRRRGTSAPMVDPVRQAAIRSINLRYANQLKPNEPLPNKVLQDLAVDTGCSVGQIKKALSSAPLSARELPQAAVVLQKILHQSASPSSKANRLTP